MPKRSNEFKRATLPVEGKAIRFAPGHGQDPAAWFWKVWAEGNEVYALARTLGGQAKISVHGSGQIHYRLGPKQKQDLAPPMPLGSGPWFHAFEIRFLLSQGAHAPPNEKEFLKNRSAYLIPVAEGFILCANLIVGAAGTPLNCPGPAEFTGAQALWRVQLRDGRPAILLARVLELDSGNREHIKYLRETLKPTATFSATPTETYIELQHLHWSPEGGNIVLVVPMGDEAIRSEQEMTPPIGPSGEPRKFRYQSPRSTTDVVAPNGDRVATLEFDEVDKEIELVKNRPSQHGIGKLKMRLEPSNLIAGSKFMAPPCRLECVPIIGGGSPRSWEHTVFAQFDGFTLSVEIRPMSSSLRNSNLTAAVSQLDDREELVFAIPDKASKLLATMDAPGTTMEVLGGFTLRDSR
jgi:hypothetical protein